MTEHETDRQRIKILRITGASMISVLMAVQNKTCVGFPVLDLPAGFQIDRINYDFKSNCFELAIQHKSFKVVPIGGVPPAFVDDMRIISLKDILVEAGAEAVAKWRKDNEPA